MSINGMNLQKLILALCFSLSFVACTDDEKIVQFGEDDQGGVYLELKQGDETRKWRIDTGNDEQSAQILAYKA